MKGKVLVSLIAVFSMTLGSVAAKAADYPINELLSEKKTVMNNDEAEFIDYEDFSVETETYECLEDFGDYSTSKDFVEVELINSEDTSYELIGENGIELLKEGESAEPYHIHDYKSIVIKEHKKKSDGSCVTTYYDGKRCTKCNSTLKGDVIKTVTENPCTH